MFGVLPAYGFYCRHVRGLKFHNIRLDTTKPDLRHALVCDDVKDLIIDGLDAACRPDAEPIVHFIQVEGRDHSQFFAPRRCGHVLEIGRQCDPAGSTAFK